MRKVGKKMTYRKYLKACYGEHDMKGYDGDKGEPKRKRKRDEPSKAKTSTKEEVKQTKSSNVPKEKVTKTEDIIQDDCEYSLFILLFTITFSSI